LGEEKEIPGEKREVNQGWEGKEKHKNKPPLGRGARASECFFMHAAALPP